ncbi:MAG: prepilin-type N-terminal cleavage/methylation domain-containing protein [Rhodanobacteraceae bacterium]
MTARPTSIGIHVCRSPLPGSRVQRSPGNPALGVLPRAFGHARDASGIAQTRGLTPGPRSRSSRGFTLLEILVALVLLAFVMVGVWGALAGATRVSHSADAVMAQNEQVRTVQQFLRRYLSAAQMQPYVTGADAPARMFEGDATRMRYVAPLPAQSGHAGLYLQTVTLRKNDADGASLELSYQPYSGNAPASGQPVVHLLLAHLRGGQFQYLSAAALGQPPSWRDDWQAVNGLPMAVRIRVDPAWRTRVPFPRMVIPIHAGDGYDARVGASP